MNNLQPPAQRQAQLLISTGPRAGVTCPYELDLDHFGKIIYPRRLTCGAKIDKEGSFFATAQKVGKKLLVFQRNLNIG